MKGKPGSLPSEFNMVPTNRSDKSEGKGENTHVQRSIRSVGWRPFITFSSIADLAASSCPSEGEVCDSPTCAFRNSLPSHEMLRILAFELTLPSLRIELLDEELLIRVCTFLMLALLFLQEVYLQE